MPHAFPAIRRLPPGLLPAIALVLGLAFPRLEAADPASAAPLPEAGLVTAIEQAGTNRIALETALGQVPAGQRPALIFLLTHMPAGDLTTLSAGFLLEDIALAHETLAAAPWADQIPGPIFLNHILPYANIDETREDWRPVLREIALPLIEGCRTPSEAAQRLNERLFAKVNVRYSTQRRRANQSPSESMETGLASCTGLSILLVNACRAVGVPARLVGIPSWVDKRGNHTWVEIWDGGWHYTGAAEPDPAGLNRGWFTGDASRALRDTPRHAIYAVSFQRTDTPFPLVWSRQSGSVSAENVTDRYTRDARPVPDDETHLRIVVRDRRDGDRVATRVRAFPLDPASGGEEAGGPVDAAQPEPMEGFSRDESADTNDLLEFALRRGLRYRIDAEAQGRTIVLETPPLDKPRDQVLLFLDEVQLAGLLPPVCYVPPRAAPLSEGETRQLGQALEAFFRATPSEQAAWTFDPLLDVLVADNDPAVRKAAWQAYVRIADAGADRADFEAGRVRSDGHESPYVVRTIGERPADGWPLFIAMHGGGNTPQEVNDRQWRVMQQYYRDHPEVGGYRYLALRAPNNTWNGFYDDYVYPLVARLIRQFLAFDDINPNKVFLMGYSHGGYGAFAIGPKMPDHFAAIHASAAAPTDGETSARTLRNTIFTYMIGEHDTAYGRLERCQRFDALVRELRGNRIDTYPVLMEYKAGYRHSGLPDRDKIPDMYPAVRHPAPRELSWELTDPVIRSFFWLHVPRPAKGMTFDASCRNNHLEIRLDGVPGARVRLDSRLVRFNQPITASVNGTPHAVEVRPGLRTLLLTLMERGDPELAFTAEWEVPLPDPG